jgi:heat shock protein HtpX
MCLDNPREGFSNLFDTHPSIEARVAAIIKFAGGHNPGPLVLADPDRQIAEPVGEPVDQAAEDGPWGCPREEHTSGEKPFLPSRPPLELGGDPTPGVESGPWDRRS